MKGLRDAGVRGATKRQVAKSCEWPSCDQTVTTFRSQAAHITLCPEHYAGFKNTTGHLRLNGLGRVLANLNRVYAGRNVPTTLQAVLFILCGGKCGACQVPLVFATRGKTWNVDHVIPIYKGGLTTRENLMPLCRACHVAKTRPEIQEIRKLFPNTSARFWRTHSQKDIEIATLKTEIVRLRSIVDMLTARTA